MNIDYEKKYKEALERAKKLKENPKAIFFEEKNIPISDYIFPELKESEDEKIRKGLIEFLSHIANEHHIMVKAKFFNWLEKQGEQKPDWSEEDENICRTIINDIANDKSMCKYEISKGVCDTQINWLKSLKDRLKGELL